MGRCRVGSLPVTVSGIYFWFCYHVIRRRRLNTTGRIYDGLLRFFEDWFYLQNDEELFLNLSYEGRNGEFACYAQAVEPTEQLLFYSVFPVPVPAERRPAMAELLIRINYGLAIGSFDMDLSDGEVRFRTSLDVRDVGLTDDLIRPVVYTNLYLMDHYFTALGAVCEGKKTPAEALAPMSRLE